MKLAIDCDDVIVDFWPRVIKCHNKEYGTDFKPEQQLGWDDNPIKTSPFFGEGKMYADWWEWWQAKPSLWATCGALDGALGGLVQLHEMGHYVELVTSKPSWARRDFFEWLHLWQPFFDALTIIEEGSGVTKASVTDADILIDDRPSNVSSWVETGRKAVLFDRPWNGASDFKYYKGMVQRLTNWEDIVTYAKTLPVGEADGE